MPSLLDSAQILKGAYEDASAALKVRSLNSMMPVAYDYVSVAYPVNTTEVYTFKTGGSGGTTVGTVTVVYTDSTKASISTAART